MKVGGVSERDTPFLFPDVHKGVTRIKLLVKLDQQGVKIGPKQKADAFVCVVVYKHFVEDFRILPMPECVTDDASGMEYVKLPFD